MPKREIMTQTIQHNKIRKVLADLAAQGLNAAIADIQYELLGADPLSGPCPPVRTKKLEKELDTLTKAYYILIGAGSA